MGKDDQEEQQLFTTPLGVSKRNQDETKQQWQDAFKGNTGVIAKQDENEQDNKTDWENAFSDSKQIGIANKTQY